MSVFHIVIAMKPIDGNFTQNAIEHGVAGLNVDATRVAFQSEEERQNLKRPMTENKGIGWKNVSQFMGYESEDGLPPELGRWPANVVLAHHAECEKKGTKKIKGHKYSGKAGHGKCGQVYAKGIVFRGDTVCYADGKEVVQDWNCHSDCQVGKMDKQSGIIKTGEKIQRAGKINNWTGHTDRDTCNIGNAARFFKKVQDD